MKVKNTALRLAGAAMIAVALAPWVGGGAASAAAPVYLDAKSERHDSATSTVIAGWVRLTQRSRHRPTPARVSTSCCPVDGGSARSPPTSKARASSPSTTPESADWSHRAGRHGRGRLHRLTTTRQLHRRLVDQPRYRGCAATPGRERHAARRTSASTTPMPPSDECTSSTPVTGPPRTPEPGDLVDPVDHHSTAGDVARTTYRRDDPVDDRRHPVTTPPHTAHDGRATTTSCARSGPAVRRDQRQGHQGR